MKARVGRGWMAAFTLAWLVIWMVQLTPLQLLLPLQLDDQISDGGQQWVRGVVISGVILGIGGLAGVIAGPLAGGMSDRMSRGRRPWAVGGSLLAACCLVLTGFAHHPLLVGAAWIGVSVGIAVASAAYTALIADQLPADQRGAAAAAVGSSQAAGIVVGVGIMVTLGLTVVAGYLLLAVLIAVAGAGIACLLPDPTADHPARERDTQLPRLRSLRDSDFAWMLAGRFVANIGNALGTSLFLFFLLYGLDQPKSDAENNLLLLVVVYTVFVVIASIASGMYSDRTGSRRMPTVAAAMIQALSGVLIVLQPTFTMTMVGAALMGIGYGTFSTVGLAFATDLLPHEEDHGRDLGVVNTSAALGQLIGPMLGAGLVAAVGGFWLLFAMASALSVIGGLLTLRAREQRLISADIKIP